MRYFKAITWLLELAATPIFLVISYHLLKSDMSAVIATCGWLLFVFSDIALDRDTTAYASSRIDSAEMMRRHRRVFVVQASLLLVLFALSFIAPSRIVSLIAGIWLVFAVAFALRLGGLARKEAPGKMHGYDATEAADTRRIGIVIGLICGLCLSVLLLLVVWNVIPARLALESAVLFFVLLFVAGLILGLVFAKRQ